MTENELLEELVAETEVPPLGADEVTADMFAERLHISRSAAYHRLEEFERQNKLISRVARRRGRYVRAWHRPD